MATNWNPKRYRAPSQRDTEQFLREQLRKESERRQDAGRQAMHWRNLALHLWDARGRCGNTCQTCAEIEKAFEDVD